MKWSHMLGTTLGAASTPLWFSLRSHGSPAALILEKIRIRGELTALYLKEGGSWVGARFFSQGTNDKARRNVLKFQQERFRSDIGKKVLH